MKISKSILTYSIIISIFCLLIWLVLDKGYLLEEGKLITAASETAVTADSGGSLSVFETFVKEFVHNLKHPLAILIIQLIIIISISRLFGYLFTKIRQPSVVGEIVAGIVLGPSLVGMYFPEFSAFLFPAESLKPLQFFSQIGLVLFMFIIGMELDVKVLKHKAQQAVVISHASIVFPYFLGVLLSLFIYKEYCPDTVEFMPFALFMGIAMSITAFPVLARIVQERGITKTHIGTLAITCAAADDVTAWCILAAVIAIVKAGNIYNALFTIALSVGYVIVMLKIVQPFLKKFGSVYVSKENLNKTVVAFIFIIMLGSAYMTEVIGIHALFGAFLAGVIMPQNLNFKKVLVEKIEDVSLVLLLPLFFVFTGLRTQIGLLNDPTHWLVCFIVIAVAVVGKFGGSMVAARIVGEDWKSSLSIGALMNTRGLMELIVLNIGYDLGILSPEIFAMMVLMALSTTLMTNPVLEFIDWIFAKFEKAKPVEDIHAALDILISFGPSKTGSALMRLANFITAGKRAKKITAMHLTPSLEINPHDALLFEKEAFGPVRLTGHELGLGFETKYKAVDDVEKEIIQTARQGQYELLLVGSAKSAFTEKITGGKIKHIIESVDCTVGILVDNNFRTAENVLFLLSGEEDEYLSGYAQKFIAPEKVKITMLNVNENQALDKAFLEQFQLVVLDIKHWKKAAEAHSAWISYSPSLLIFSKGKL
ncbi:MAG: Glutathione-regulated potassium-efflux system protein KefB [Bacteroidia bacterium]|nr:Glutathione-regulated potassium-efflux system protein KefB [Bacteroidia bacterium]